MSNEIYGIVREHSGPARAEGDQAIPDALVQALQGWNPEKWVGEVEDHWLPEVVDIFRGEGDIAFRQLGFTPDTFSMQDPAIIRAIHDRRDSLARAVGHTTQDAISRAVHASVEGKETVRDLMKRLQSSPEIGNDVVRAERIARTETSIAAGTSTMQAYHQARAAGVRLKKRWNDVGDDLVRASHAAATAQGPIPLDQPFINGLMFPGDPSGLPEDVINERCYLSPVQEN